MAKIYWLKEFRSNYKGRGKAKVIATSAIVVIKDDGTVIVHDPVKGVKPLNYNPTGECKVTEKKGLLSVRSTSKKGETLSISGRIKHKKLISSGETNKIHSTLAGSEASIKNDIVANPSIVGLKKITNIEELIMSGRIDLLSPTYIIEIKKNAGVRTISQIERYLREFPARKGLIVCQKASKTLVEAVKKQDRITLKVLDQK